MSGTVVVTVVRGRHQHLLAQRAHLRALPDPPRHVIVAMADPQIAALCADDPQVEVLELELREGRLPLAEARNLGVAAALSPGPGGPAAELVVLLDVDCLPGAGLVPGYHRAAELVGETALLCGPVSYLPPEAGAPTPDLLAGWTRPHPARPDPAAGTLLRGGDHRLFWSLSFAVTPQTWQRIGGFSTAYAGYGGEDTDFGFRARRAGVELVWVGGAHAYHQYHPVSDPPVEHLDDILRNAATFHQQWGVWPMEGWLAAFARLGLARCEEGRWVKC